MRHTMKKILLVLALVLLPRLAAAGDFVTNSSNDLYPDKAQGVLCPFAVSNPAKCWRYGDANAVKNALKDLRAHASGWISCKDVTPSCAGDGTTDDTTAIAAAISAAGSTRSVYFPPGTYLVTNLTHGAAPWVGAGRGITIIRAKAGGDARYLVASPNWLEAGATNASNPWRAEGIEFDAAGLKTNTLVLRAFFSRVKDCWIKGATGTDLLISTDAADATALASTMVNNEFVGNWYGSIPATSQYNFRTLDSGSKATDATLVGSYMFGASIANLSVEASAGWLVEGNHFYGAPESVHKLGKPNIGTRFVGNYPEGDCRFESTQMVGALTVGPGNYFLANVWADFGFGDVIVLSGNHIAGEVRHNFWSPAKVLVSSGDVYHLAQPFKHYSSSSDQSLSTGRFVVDGATIAPIARKITATFDGADSTAAGTMHRPASWDADRYSAIGTTPISMRDGALPRHMKLVKGTVATTTPITLTARMTALGNDESYRVEVSIASRRFHSDSIRTQYLGVFNVIRKSGTSDHYVTPCFENLTAAQFAAVPALTAAMDGTDLVVTLTATQAALIGGTDAQDGFGGATLAVF